MCVATIARRFLVVIMRYGKPKTKYANRLKLTRKRRGIGQRQVASLLGFKKPTPISLYEHGSRLPSLETALGFEYIYDTPLSDLFYGLSQELQQNLHTKISGSQIYNARLVNPTKFYGHCGYKKLLEQPNLSQSDVDSIKSHITLLARILANR